METQKLNSRVWFEPDIRVVMSELYGQLNEEDYVKIDCTEDDPDIDVTTTRDGQTETHTWKLWEILEMGIKLARGEI